MFAPASSYSHSSYRRTSSGVTISKAHPYPSPSVRDVRNLLLFSFARCRQFPETISSSSGYGSLDIYRQWSRHIHLLSALSSIHNHKFHPAVRPPACLRCIAAAWARVAEACQEHPILVELCRVDEVVQHRLRACRGQRPVGGEL